MAKRSGEKRDKTDIVDAVVQDVELTVEQAETAAKKSFKAVAKGLNKMLKPAASAPAVPPPGPARRGRR